MLRFDAPLSDFVKQADQLFAGWQSGEGPSTRDDASLAVARAYNFLDWPSLQAYATAVADKGSAVSRFEHAVEAVIDGAAATLRRLLGEDPELVRARSTRVCNFDPPVHRSTLLHYLAANGVENYRQRSPKNAVEIAKLLLDAGADPNALQDSYGGRNTIMAMLVSSSPPRDAGVQVPMIDVLVDYGAAIVPTGEGVWASPAETALVFNMCEAAEALVRRGARIDTVATAAGLGRLDDVRRMLPSATPGDRHRAMALAAQCGHADVLAALIDAGEDPNRFNPPGTHSHSPPLHQAIAAGHLDAVKLLVERGARLDIKDTIYDGTPLGWAEYCHQPAIADFLRGLTDLP